MNPITNPYAPGAGSPPPELSGRDELRNRSNIAFQRVRIGKAAKSILLVGLRGVGKTVLLEQIRSDAEQEGIVTIKVEAPEGKSLPAMLLPQLRLGLLRLSRSEKAKEYAIRSLRGIAGFVSSLKLVYSDIEVGIDYAAEKGLADNGDLESDLAALLSQVGLAAQAEGTLFAIFIDELQYVSEHELGALISALHHCSQKKLPLLLVGAGLPQLRGKMGDAKSYAERLFEFAEIGPLDPDDAKDAIVKPAKDEGVEINEDAVDLIVGNTHGYPYFLQEWGKHTWDVAPVSPITSNDVETATVEVVAALDESFFKVRFERLTAAEKNYLRAMAELGPGPHRSGDIAGALNRTVSSFGPVRNSLIQKGMIWSPSHGDTAFTVPLFDDFMKRIMPDDSWKTP